MTISEPVRDADIIFVGGGTAACVAAGRLAKANPDLKILVIEGGKNNFKESTVVNPALVFSRLTTNSTMTLSYKSKPCEHLGGREIVVRTGGILGGGSSINYMMYARAQSVDFDSWQTPQWSAKEMLPLCNKVETFHQQEKDIDPSKHGYKGPIHVSDGGFRGKSEKQFIRTIKSMGFREIVDLQDFEQVGGFTRMQRYVSPEGKRQDAAHCYVHPLLEDGKHPNLHVLIKSKVARVIFDRSNPPRAIGVEYIRLEDDQPSIATDKRVRHIVKARKLVVLAAGALGTPLILERSGIGNADILHQLDIPVICDLPGVGENYQDHQVVASSYKTSLDPSDTLDGIISGREKVMEALEEKDPILGWNGIDVGAKLRMSPGEVAALGPDFQNNWNRDFEPFPTRPDMLYGAFNGGQYLTVATYTAYPYSRGSIHIKSMGDVSEGYDFDAGILSHPSDIKKQLWAYKKAREVARRLPYYRGEVESGHPKFPRGSKAGLVDLKGQRESDGQVGGHRGIIEDIIYSAEDDAAIESWIRANITSAWHSLGTCAMKPREKLGVVSGELNVYGTTGLKVADLSIVPENVGANTCNTALAVGEKAAVIIGKELGFEV